MVDFSKSNKPAHPPVPLRVALKQTTVGTMLIEFTDPSGTLNNDTQYPLNIWTTEREMPTADKCVLRQCSYLKWPKPYYDAGNASSHSYMRDVYYLSTNSHARLLLSLIKLPLTHTRVYMY